MESDAFIPKNADEALKSPAKDDKRFHNLGAQTLQTQTKCQTGTL